MTVLPGVQHDRDIRGIDRAYNALEGLDSPSIGEQMRRKKLDDARELMTLVRLGQ